MRDILNYNEYVELVRLIQIIEIGKNAFPDELDRKKALETKGLRRQLAKAQLAARYPSFANHLHGNENPYSRTAKPYGMAPTR